MRCAHDETLTASSRVEVKLFTKGRLHGQAFVRLPTVHIAQAIKEDLHGLWIDKKALSVVRRCNAAGAMC